MGNTGTVLLCGGDLGGEEVEAGDWKIGTTRIFKTEDGREIAYRNDTGPHAVFLGEEAGTEK